MDPERKFGYPVWWHHHGTKVNEISKKGGDLIIKGSAATLKISMFGNLWQVSWKVIFSFNSGVEGTVVMTSAELENAFDIAPSPTYFGKHIIDRFGADTAKQGKYIRWKKFLNIPGPGTDLDGDPNISILVTDEIKKAVQELR